MKYIHIIVINQDCKEVTAHALVFNCENMEFNEEIQYPINSTKEEIKDIINSSIVDYSITLDHVGGRPNDR